MQKKRKKMISFFPSAPISARVLPPPRPPVWAGDGGAGGRPAWSVKVGSRLITRDLHHLHLAVPCEVRTTLRRAYP